MHLSPCDWPNIQANLWAIQQHFPALISVVNHNRTGAMHAHQHLLQAAMGMIAASHTFTSIKHIVDTFDVERNLITRFKGNELSPRITVCLKTSHLDIHATLLAACTFVGSAMIPETSERACRNGTTSTVYHVAASRMA